MGRAREMLAPGQRCFPHIPRHSGQLCGGNLGNNMPQEREMPSGVKQGRVGTSMLLSARQPTKTHSPSYLSLQVVMFRHFLNCALHAIINTHGCKQIISVFFSFVRCIFRFSLFYGLSRLYFRFEYFLYILFYGLYWFNFIIIALFYISIL